MDESGDDRRPAGSFICCADMPGDRARLWHGAGDYRPFLEVISSRGERVTVVMHDAALLALGKQLAAEMERRVLAGASAEKPAEGPDYLASRGLPPSQGA